MTIATEITTTIEDEPQTFDEFRFCEQRRDGAIFYDMAQHSPEWFEVRAGIPTASEFDSIITPLWKPRTGDGVDTYLARKLAERWLGRPITAFSGGSMEQGTIKEEEASPAYQFLTGEQIKYIGFVTTADKKIGCSPDGLLDGGGIEIKCPEAHTHCRYLLNGGLPKDYAAQVHGSMLVTGAGWWRFMSYCRGFPPLILTVDREETIIASLREAIDSFNEKLDVAYARIVELNGGENKRSRK